MTHRPPKHQRGQAASEYVLLVAAMAAFMFVPNPLLHDPNNGQPISLFVLFIEAFEIYINSFHTVITLPFP